MGTEVVTVCKEGPAIIAQAGSCAGFGLQCFCDKRISITISFVQAMYAIPTFNSNKGAAADTSSVRK